MSERKVVAASGAPEAAGPYSHAIAHGGGQRSIPTTVDAD